MNLQSIIIFFLLILTLVIISFKIFHSKKDHCWYCNGDCSHCKGDDKHSES